MHVYGPHNQSIKAHFVKRHKSRANRILRIRHWQGRISAKKVHKETPWFSWHGILRQTGQTKFTEPGILNGWLNINTQDYLRPTDIDIVYFRLKGPENARIRGNPYKIVINQCRLNVRKIFLVSMLLSLGIVCLQAWSILHLYEPPEEL